MNPKNEEAARELNSEAASVRPAGDGRSLLLDLGADGERGDAPAVPGPDADLGERVQYIADSADYSASVLEQAVTTITRQSERIAELERALEPFAKAIQQRDDQARRDGYELCGDSRVLSIMFTAGDFRRARAALASAQTGTGPTVIDEIAAERRRQIEAEGWTPEYDDEHSFGEMAIAAACYAHPGIPLKDRLANVPKMWPWRRECWKPKDRRRDLIRAAALLVAEIERLDRASAQTGTATTGAGHD
jgi:hypothetical protein